jgi:hypothetical protein
MNNLGMSHPHAFVESALADNAVRTPLLDRPWVERSFGFIVFVIDEQNS